MNLPSDTALLRHKARRHDLPTVHERELRTLRRAARRAAFRRFLAQVFASPPRHLVQRPANAPE